MANNKRTPPAPPDDGGNPLARQRIVCRDDVPHRFVAALFPEHTFHTDYLLTWWECACRAQRWRLTKNARRP